MTWTLQMSGHKADPGEEEQLRDKLREVIEDIRASVATDIFEARFTGSYGSEDFMVALESDTEDPEAPEEA